MKIKEEKRQKDKCRKLMEKKEKKLNSNGKFNNNYGMAHHLFPFQQQKK